MGDDGDDVTATRTRCGATCKKNIHIPPGFEKCGSQCDQWEGHSPDHSCPTHGSGNF